MPPPLPHATAEASPPADGVASSATIPPPPPTPRPTPTPTTDTAGAAAAAAAAAAAHPALAADLVFATFWVAPGIAPEDYASRRPDLRFGAAIRAAHPGKRVHVAVLTDAETVVLDEEEEQDGTGSGDQGGGGRAGGHRHHLSAAEAAAGGEVEVFRCAAIERARLGRNAYANFAQMVAQSEYLAHLERLVAATGGAVRAHPPVVFCDTDMLFVGDVSEVVAALPPGLQQTVDDEALVPRPPALGGTDPARATPYDYALTISDSVDM